MVGNSVPLFAGKHDGLEFIILSESSQALSAGTHLGCCVESHLFGVHVLVGTHKDPIWPCGSFFPPGERHTCGVERISKAVIVHDLLKDVG